MICIACVRSADAAVKNLENVSVKLIVRDGVITDVPGTFTINICSQAPAGGVVSITGNPTKVQLRRLLSALPIDHDNPTLYAAAAKLGRELTSELPGEQVMIVGGKPA